MKRSSEKTFGRSPEFQAHSKPPRKRAKLESRKIPRFVTEDTTTNDSSDDSDFHPPPSGKPRANTKRPSLRSCTAASKRCGTSEDDDQDLPAIQHTPNPKMSARQARGSVVPNDESASVVESKSTASSLDSSRKAQHDGNILDRLGRLPGLSPPRSGTENEVKNESDHSGTQEQDLPRVPPARTRPNTRPNSKKEVKGKIIAAVDFGTTYSGICWAHTDLEGSSKLITKWPDTKSEEGHSGEKVPTELEYIGADNWLWGSGIPASAKRLQWFKLELQPDTTKDYSRLEDEYPDERAARRTPQQTPEKLTKDYLTSLRIHFEHMLSKVLGPGSLTTTPIEYVLTVPAIWTDLAKSKTKLCAEQAGMGSAAELNIIPEPEAAAVWAFHEMAPYSLEKGETFVVCDAGGGTVDLITYEIVALRPSLRIVEVAKGEGGMCGSTILDRRFALFLAGKFGDHEMWSESLLEEAKAKFESDIKTGFAGRKEEEWDVPVPGLPNSSDDDPDRIRHSRYSMKGSDIYNIFEPVIKEIISLVSQQIELSKGVGANVKAVIMVGGLGENLYLYERLRKVLAYQDIGVQVSPQAWTAVVRGALIRGLEEAKSKRALGTVVGRVAREFYGTECAREYERAKHPKSEREWSEANSRYEVNTYDWFIQKHQKIAEKQPILRHYHVERPVPRPSTKTLDPVIITIVKCENNQAPTIVGKGQVAEVARLEVPLSRLPKKTFEIREGDSGQQWYIIDFTLRATCHSAETYYDLLYRTRNYGRVVAEYV